MKNEESSPHLDKRLFYEQLVTVSFFLFLRSTQLYSQVVNQRMDQPQILKNIRIQKGIAQIIKTVQDCGKVLEMLPAPPMGAEASDRYFRELAIDMHLFAGLLSDLARFDKSFKKQPIPQEFHTVSERIKYNFREAILSYEQAYPGRLARIMNSQSLQTKYNGD